MRIAVAAQAWAFEMPAETPSSRSWTAARAVKMHLEVEIR